MHANSLVIERRWSKTPREDTFDIPFAWSATPSKRALLWLKNAIRISPKKSLWPELCAKQSDGYAAAHITKCLRKAAAVLGDVKLENAHTMTSYIFRDLMEVVLKQHLTPEQHERFVEHTAATGRASYAKTPVSQARVAEVVKKLNAAVEKKTQTKDAKKKRLRKNRRLQQSRRPELRC